MSERFSTLHLWEICPPGKACAECATNQIVQQSPSCEHVREVIFKISEIFDQKRYRFRKKQIQPWEGTITSQNITKVPKPINFNYFMIFLSQEIEVLFLFLPGCRLFGRSLFWAILGLWPNFHLSCLTGSSIGFWVVCLSLARTKSLPNIMSSCSTLDQSTKSSTGSARKRPQLPPLDTSLVRSTRGHLITWEAFDGTRLIPAGWNFQSHHFQWYEWLNYIFKYLFGAKLPICVVQSNLPIGGSIEDQHIQHPHSNKHTR